MRTSSTLPIAVALATVLVGCSKSDPLYCDPDTPCDDPDRPYCDLDGEFPASDGLGRTCIAEPDFAVSLASGDGQVRIGDEAAIEVDVDRIDGFPSDILVEATGLPAGTSADPLTIPGDAATGMLTIHGGDADPGAIAMVTITATASPAAGPIQHSADLHLLVLGPAGSLDPTFGALGLAAEPPDTTDDATGLAQLPDGSLIVVGATFAGDSGAMLRYSSEGVLDTSFGVEGVREIDLSASGIDIVTPFRVAQQSDGSVIVAVGSTTGKLALARYTVGGLLDPDFASDGLVISPVTTVPLAVGGIATGPDDEIVVGIVASGATDKIHVVRFSRDGVRDESFAGGRLDLDRGTTHRIAVVRVLSDGAVIVAGSAVDDASDRIPFVARFTPQGAADLSFGGGGVVQFAQGINPDAALELADGALMVAGNIATGGTPPNEPTFWRLTSTGDLDARFGVDGQLTLDRNGGVVDMIETVDSLTAVAYYDITLIRLDPVTGELDGSFGDAGIATLPLAEGSAKRAVKRADRRFVVLADEDSFQFVLARFFE